MEIAIAIIIIILIFIISFLSGRIIGLNETVKQARLRNETLEARLEIYYKAGIEESTCKKR